MCGRYGLYRPTDVLAKVFGAREAQGLRERYAPSYNIAPTADVVGLAAGEQGERILDLYRWGLAGRLFNARAESLAASHAFGGAMRRRRLALLADGFFEWRQSPGRRGQPLFFTRADGTPLALAGIWEARDSTLRTCSMVTTAAGTDIAEVHDRMPVILEPDALEVWLDPASRNLDELEGVLRPAPGGTLVHHAVDPRVGDVRNDSPDLILPFQSPTDDFEALRLFG